jgi:predicted RNA binding protein with dsRBD fold (UPF0201 family)
MKKLEVEEDWKVEDAIETFMRFQRIQEEVKDKSKIKKAIKDKMESLKKLDKEIK